MLPKEDFSAIISETFHLKSVTPVSIHGADGKTPELRLASIKGMMRYWYRMVQENPSESLQKEGEIFGLAQKDKAKKSKVWLTSQDSISPRNKSHMIDEWEITLSFVEKSQKPILATISSFLLAVLLGGFGTKSRHSYSSFSIKEIPIKTPEYFIGVIEELISQISDISVEKTYHGLLRNDSVPHKGPYWNGTYVFPTEETDIASIQQRINTARKSAKAPDNKNEILGGRGTRNTRYPSPLITSIYPLETSGNLIIVSEVYPEKFNTKRYGNASNYEQAKETYIRSLEDKL